MRLLSNNTNKNQAEPKLDFEKLIETPEFKDLTKRKSAFLRPYVIFFCLAYALLPILTAYTTILEKHAIGYITWTWIYAFSLFAMTGILSIIYTRKAMSFDKDVEEIMKNTIIK